MKRGRPKKVIVDAVPSERVNALVKKIDDVAGEPVSLERMQTINTGIRKASMKQVDVIPSQTKRIDEPKAIEPVRQPISAEIISSLVLNGDVGKMSAEQKVEYYNGLCGALGLNPLTRPFQLITLNGKQVLYAAKDATDQLRKLNGVSVIESTQTIINDICTVTVKVSDKSGRMDCEIGAVNVKGLTGDSLANAMMKASTKAKRRATLSICGLGVLDETEIETIPGAVKNITPHTDAPAQVHPIEVSQDAPPSVNEKNDLLDMTVYCTWKKSHNYGKRWDEMGVDDLSRALDFLDTTYKGKMRDEMIASIEQVLTDIDNNVQKKTATDNLDRYDGKLDRFVNGKGV